MDLAIRRETFSPPEDQSWLNSRHGTDATKPITLDSDAFLATFTDGVVPSGTVIAIRTSDDLAVPYNNASGVAGVATAVGHLFTTKQVRAGTRIPGALYWHGAVRRSKLATGHGLDTAAEADLKHIRYSA